MAAPRSVRAKLLSAIVALLTLMFGSAILAISGFNRTGEAVTSLSSQRLPDIITASTLARESSALASLAPFVSSVEVMAQLETERLRVEAMIGQLQRAVDDLQDSEAFRGEDGARMRALAATLSTAIRNLVDASRAGLELRAEGVELQYGFDRQADVRQALDPVDSPGVTLAFSRLIGLLQTARLTSSPLLLDQLQRDYTQLAADLPPTSDPAAARLAARFLDQQGSIFELRRSELEVQQRIRFLLASIQRMSDDLSTLVTGLVTQTARAAEAQNQALDETLSTTRRNIAVLGAVALLAGLMTAVYVLSDLVPNLQAVTSAMSRLAAGDRSADIPGLERGDELGSLARAFSVFKSASHLCDEILIRMLT